MCIKLMDLLQIYRIQGQYIQPFARLDRLVYENFLGGRYDDNVPIFHIDGNEWNCNVDNLHVGFMEDPRYPNEIWAIYHLKDLPGAINDDIITDYWISTYGRCYGTTYSMFMKPSSNSMYPIRIKTDEIFWRPITLMIAETFIPNRYKIPYAILKNRSLGYHISNVAWSYDEYVYISLL